MNIIKLCKSCYVCCRYFHKTIIGINSKKHFIFTDCWFDCSIIQKCFLTCCYEFIYHISRYEESFSKHFTHKILNDVYLNCTSIDRFFEENEFEGLEGFTKSNFNKTVIKDFDISSKQNYSTLPIYQIYQKKRS